MIKKIIALTLCIILCLCLFTTTACAATDISKIETSNRTVIITDPPEVPVHKDALIMPDTTNKTIIIIGQPITEVDILQSKKAEEDSDISTVTYTDEQTGTETIIPNGAAILDELAQEIFELTNQERVSRGLTALTYSEELQEAANIRAKESSIQFSHTRPDGSSCHSIVEDMDYSVTGENLIMADQPLSSAEILVDTWMNSEGHRYNILLPEFTKIAIGVYIKDNITYATQIFMG